MNYLKRIIKQNAGKRYFREVLTAGDKEMPYSSMRRWIVEGCWHGHRHGHGHRHDRGRSGEASTAAAATPSALFVVVYINQVCLLTRTHLRLTKERIPSEGNKLYGHPSPTESHFSDAYMDHCVRLVGNVVVFGDFYQVALHQDLGRGLHAQFMHQLSTHHV